MFKIVDWPLRRKKRIFKLYLFQCALYTDYEV
jgi:hypothetical protein